MKTHGLPAAAYNLGESGRMFSVDLIICLVALNIISVIYYGMRVLLLTAAAVVACVLCESVACAVMRRKNTAGDLSAAALGMVIAALCPATAPIWLPVIGGAFAVLAVKIPFGGKGHLIFSPAAAAWLFMAFAFPSAMFGYTLPGAPDIMADAPLADLAAGVTPGITKTEIILGSFAGPMGATPMLVVAACALYLIIRRTASPAVMLGFIGSCAIFALLFPRIDARAHAAAFELASGCLMFTAVFIAADLSTAPKTTAGRVTFGILCGMITMLLRYFGTAFDEGAPAAVVIMNIFTAAIDGFFLDVLPRLRDKLHSHKPAKKEGEQLAEI